MHWIDLGYFGLFLASFLAATILPFSSEVVLGGMLASGFEPMPCLLSATSGNWVGGMSTYYLGYLGKWEWIEKYLKVKKEATIKWQERVQKFGSYFALLSWLPVIGDVIALALGLAKTSVIPSAIFMLVGKAIRYAVIIYLVIEIL